MSRQSELRSLIMKAKQAYYYGSNPIMTDAEYDALEDELRLIDPNDPVLAIVGAPIPPDSILTKASHSITMGSQGKINSVDQFLTWHEKYAQGDQIHASLKGDGASAAAYYENGHLKQVISRGDGKVGEDITANAIKFKGLPAYISAPLPFSGAVRFEVMLTVEDWGVIDPEKLTNPRNMGTGIMGRKNGHQSELLTTYAFDIDERIDGNHVDFQTEYEKSKRLEELGFHCMDYHLCDTTDDVIAYYEKVTVIRDTLPIWIDGVVLKINTIKIQDALGITSGRPKGQVAWKFDSEGAESVLLNVSISGGHTGALIPNARFEPVKIGGTTVQNASLSNWEEIKRLDLAIGDKIWVIKANDIIPKIIRVTEKGENRREITAPTTCPFCDGQVSRRVNTGGDEGVILECQNKDCPKKSTGKIKRWIKSVDIQGIGESVLEAMVEQLDMNDVSDLYSLHIHPLRLASIIINTEKEIKLGEKRATSILDSIEKARELTLVQFLGSLGVDRLGKRRVDMMIQASEGELNTLDSWRAGKLRSPDFAQKVGVPSTGDAIQDGIDDLSDIIDNLIEKGVRIQKFEPKQNNTASDSEVITVCITGKLPSGKKKSDYKAPLEAAGMKLVDNVSEGLHYLVQADPNSNSSKAQKAKKYGVALISEEELNEMI